MKVQLNQYTHKKNIEWHKRVHLSIKCGIPIKTLAKNMNVDPRTINKSYMDNFDLFNVDKRAVSLGRKSEPYFSEDEMLNGYDVSKVQFSISELDYLESL